MQNIIQHWNSYNAVLFLTSWWSIGRQGWQRGKIFTTFEFSWSHWNCISYKYKIETSINLIPCKNNFELRFLITKIFLYAYQQQWCVQYKVSSAKCIDNSWNTLSLESVDILFDRCERKLLRYFILFLRKIVCIRY